MAKYDGRKDLLEKNMRIINAVDLLLSLDKTEINYYLKMRLLYLLNPEVNDYVEYKPKNKKYNEERNKRK